MDSRRSHHNHHGYGNHNYRANGHGGKRFGGGGGRGSSGSGHSHQHHHTHHNSTGTRAPWFKGEGYNDFEVISIDEEVVGIHGFLTPEQPGFPALVKQRFSDYVVNEVTSTGHVVRLTTLAKKKKTIQAQFVDLVMGFVYGERGSTHPPTSQPPTTTMDELPVLKEPHMYENQKLIRAIGRSVSDRATMTVKRGYEALEVYNYRKLIEEVTKELGAKVGHEFTQFLDRVKQRKQAEAEAKSAGLSIDPQDDERENLVFYIGGLNAKEDRVFVHETMRRYGKSLIVADTITSPDQTQVIRVRRLVSGPQRKGERDPRRDWPVDRPDYLQFVVFKRNKEIMTILNQIAGMLKINPSLFSCADVKDKRGVMTQQCTVYRISIERFQQLFRFSTRSLEDHTYLVGDLKYVARKLTTGDCGGNQLSMVLRGIPDEQTLSDTALATAMRSWETRGFINFFALQRFGNSSTPFHMVGRALLRKDFKLAVLLLLRPQEGEASKVRQAREHFRLHKDVAAALRMFPPFLIPERAVLEGLLQHGMEANELAFRNIPMHLRVAYVEAYQNYVWNQMASLRISQFSTTHAVVGDLVYEKKTTRASTRQAGEGNDGNDDDEEDDASPRVVVVSETMVDQYTIDDVILPLPGFTVEYPQSAVGDAYKKMLSMDGVDFASWASASQSANYHPYDLRGSYRHVVRRPQHVQYEVKTYTDATQPLILTDVDRMLGRKAPRQETSATPPPPGSETVSRALVLHFRLDYGSDATIAVRELLKQSSSIHVQWQLNEQTDGNTSGTSQQQKASGDDGKRAGNFNGGGGRGKKRTLAAVTASVKDAKGAAPKKTQVAIGRPGFSLGKS